MAKVLVTGASGFIGFHLVRALVECGEEVTAMDRRPPSLWEPDRLGVRFLVGDVLDREGISAAVAGQSTVYHLAGCVAARRAGEFHRVNGDGTAAVCEACRAAGNPAGARVALLDGRQRPGAERPPQRGRRPAPAGLALRAEQAGGRVGGGAVRRSRTITIVRPAIVFGEGDPHCLSIYRSVNLSHIHFVPGRIPRRHSWIHAADLSRLLILAAARGERLPPRGDASAKGGRGYYMADGGQQPAYEEVGRMIGRALGQRRTWVIRFRRPVAWTAAAVSDLFARLGGRPALFSIDKMREAIAGSWICSGEKARGQLEFSAPVPLADRLEQAVRWYRQARWL